MYFLEIAIFRVAQHQPDRFRDFGSWPIVPVVRGRSVSALLLALVLAACGGGSHSRAIVKPSSSSTTVDSGGATSTTKAGKKPTKKAKKPAKATATTTLKRTGATTPGTTHGTTPPATNPPATSPPTSPPVTPPGLPNLASVHIHLGTVVSGLSSPVAVAWRKNDSKMYVAQQGGTIVAVSGSHVVNTVLTLAVSGGNEQGILGIAFSSDGTKLYVDYTDVAGNSHVNEFQMVGNVAKNGRQVLYQAQPFSNHNGGQLIFGTDGYLYIGFGDGGGGGDPQGNGQKLNTWLGKILRINPAKNGAAAYSVPSSNPFVGQAGKKPEIWAYGLRNPWRFSFDIGTGDMWIGDVGQDNYEEIDWAHAGMGGVNWGWNRREALHPYNGGAQPSNGRNPVIEKSHNNGYCAIIGGYVYRGSAIPALRGVYVFGDDCRNNLTGAVGSNGRIVSQRDLGPTVDQLTSFGQDLSGNLYAISRTGTIYKILAG